VISQSQKIKSEMKSENSFTECKQVYNRWRNDDNEVSHQNEREVEQVMWKDYTRRTDINDSCDATKL